MIKETEQFLKEKLTILESNMKGYISDLEVNSQITDELRRLNIADDFVQDLKKRAHAVHAEAGPLCTYTGEEFFKQIRKFILQDYGAFVDLMKILFLQVMYNFNKKNMVGSFTKGDTPEDYVFNFMGSHYQLVVLNYKTIRTTVNQFFFKDITLKDELVVDDRTELWQVSEMQHVLFASDFNKIRVYSQQITDLVKAKINADDFMLLHQQVSELIKNGIKHGNKNDPSKILKVWFSFNGECYKLIVQDEGEGFQDLEKWNEFNRKRNEALLKQDFELMMQLINYHSRSSDDTDGGNALISALEYWDSGLIYSAKKNKVLAVKYFFIDN